MMNCDPCRDLLLDILDEGTAGRFPSAAENHLAACAECRAWWDEVRSVSECLERVRATRIDPPPIASVWERIRSREAKQAEKAPAPWWRDLLGVATAASVVILLLSFLRAGLEGLVSGVSQSTPVLASALNDPVLFAGVAALAGMLAGLCAAPLLFRKQASAPMEACTNGG